MTRARQQLALRAVAVVVATLMRASAAAGQDDGRLFAGALVGVSTLSADARAVTTGSDVAISLYEPRNGVAVNLFAGVHLAEYFSVQGNWVFNRNDVTLVSSLGTVQGGGFYEQGRRSRQHAGVLDALIYFRRRDSAVRPYLGTGVALVHFVSDTITSSASRELAAPGGKLESTNVALRSHVGIDLRLSLRTSFRYSFSETIGANPISPALTPPAPRRLANFQNLFGFVQRF
jgi:outer membrane protein W